MKNLINFVPEKRKRKEENTSQTRRKCFRISARCRTSCSSRIVVQT